MSEKAPGPAQDPVSVKFVGRGFGAFVLGLAVCTGGASHSFGLFVGGLFLGALLGMVAVVVVYFVATFWFSMFYRDAADRVARVASIATGSTIGVIGAMLLLGGLISAVSPIRGNSSLRSIAVASADPTDTPEDKHAERQAILDYWNPIAEKYIDVRAEDASVGMAAYENDPVSASSTLEKASEVAEQDQLNVAAVSVPDGVEMHNDCPQANMMFVYLKQSFDGMRDALDSGKPSDAADAQDKMRQADAWFFACRHDFAARVAALGGDPTTLQTMHLPNE